MKKMLSALIATIMCMGSPVFAETDTAALETALLEVKSKVDIPAEFEEFRSSSYQREERTYYRFMWTNEETGERIEIGADAGGGICSYHDSSAYPDYEKRLITATRNEAYAVAEQCLKQMVPEMFEDENDTLVYEGTQAPSNMYTFVFKRVKNGIEVDNNHAYVSVSICDDVPKVTSLNLAINFGAEFEPDVRSGFSAEEKFKTAYPIELIYEKQYRWKYVIDSETDEDLPHLAYRPKDDDIDSISAKDGERVKTMRDPNINSYRAASGGGGSVSNAMKQEAAADMALTEAEISNINEVSGLLSYDELIARLKAIPQLKIGEKVEFNNKSYVKRDDVYYTNLRGRENNTAGGHSINASFESVSGEIVSINNYMNEGAETVNENDDVAFNQIKTFLESYAGDKLKECEPLVKEEKSESDDYYYTSIERYVNGIRYVNNYLSAGYSKKYGTLTSYNRAWDKDTGKFPKVSDAMDADTAYNRILEEYPVVKKYMYTEEGTYKPCYTLDTSYIRLEAVKNEFLSGTEADIIPEYNDLDECSSEENKKKIETLFWSGIIGGSESFNPSAAVTQKEFFEMFASGFYYYGYGMDEKNLYENMVRKGIITEEEKTPEKAVAKEDAYLYTVRFMGYGELAKLDIYKSIFENMYSMSKEKAGAATILYGMGYVDRKIEPKKSMTKEEAALLLYDYLATQ